jgi:hypothetical protein
MSHPSCVRWLDVEGESGTASGPHAATSSIERTGMSTSIDVRFTVVQSAIRVPSG